MAAWLHLPTDGQARRAGVVICSPMGYEYAHSYRSLLTLADRLAQAGLPALRLDYHGSGASPGDALTPGLVEKWIENVHSGIRVMEELTNREVSLFGLRLGATLAGVAAARFQVDHFVAWAPVVSGRSFVRELDAMAKIAGATRPEAANYLEAGGFVLADETAEDLKAIDLTRLDYRVRGDALILERDDLPTSPALASRLSAVGVHVDILEAQGYAEMMDEPQKTIVPDASLAVITDWLSARAPGDGDGSIATMAPARADRGSVRLDEFGREELVQIEGPTRLFGVYTAPAEGTTGGHPLLVLPNSGSVHQVGPNRVYVELARALARAGIPSLRLDLRNLGDSIQRGPEEENHPYPKTAMEDIGLAIEWAQEEPGYRRVVIGGICSGAYGAFQAGLELENPALVGALIVNPLTFYWHEGLSLDMPRAFQTISDAKYYEGAARDPRKWLGLLRGNSNLPYIARFLLRHAANTTKRMVDNTLEGLGLRAPKRLAQDLLRYQGSGRRADFVFSTSDPGHGILTAQAGRTLRKLTGDGTISLSFIEHADHTFSRREWRDEVARVCIARLQGYAAKTRA